jgi:hypothetical protein
MEAPPGRVFREQLPEGEALQLLHEVPPPMFPHNLESARDVCMLGSKLTSIVSEAAPLTEAGRQRARCRAPRSGARRGSAALAAWQHAAAAAAGRAVCLGLPAA